MLKSIIQSAEWPFKRQNDFINTITHASCYTGSYELFHDKDTFKELVKIYAFLQSFFALKLVIKNTALIGALLHKYALKLT